MLSSNLNKKKRPSNQKRVSKISSGASSFSEEGVSLVNDINKIYEDISQLDSDVKAYADSFHKLYKFQKKNKLAGISELYNQLQIKQESNTDSINYFGFSEITSELSEILDLEKQRNDEYFKFLKENSNYLGLIDLLTNYMSYFEKAAKKMKHETSNKKTLKNEHMIAEHQQKNIHLQLLYMLQEIKRINREYHKKCMEILDQDNDELSEAINCLNQSLENDQKNLELQKKKIEASLSQNSQQSKFHVKLLVKYPIKPLELQFIMLSRPQAKSVTTINKELSQKNQPINIRLLRKKINNPLLMSTFSFENLHKPANVDISKENDKERIRKEKKLRKISTDSKSIVRNSRVFSIQHNNEMNFQLATYSTIHGEYRKNIETCVYSNDNERADDDTIQRTCSANRNIVGATNEGLEIETLGSDPRTAERTVQINKVSSFENIKPCKVQLLKANKRNPVTWKVYTIEYPKKSLAPTISSIITSSDDPAFVEEKEINSVRGSFNEESAKKKKTKRRKIEPDVFKLETFKEISAFKFSKPPKPAKKHEPAIEIQKFEKYELLSNSFKISSSMDTSKTFLAEELLFTE